MRIKVSGRHMDIDGKLKSYAEEKSSKLERFYDRLQTVEVVFEHETGKAGQHQCEIIATADHHTTFVAKEQHTDSFASLDAAVKDLERQLTRHKEKFRNRKHITGKDDREPLGGPAPEEEAAD